MRIALQLPSHIISRIANRLRKYHELECDCPEGFACCFTSLIEEKGKICLELSTGNRWCVDLNRNLLIYEGSRYGWHSQTPFQLPDEDKPFMEIISEKLIPPEELNLPVASCGDEPVCIENTCKLYKAVKEGRAKLLMTFSDGNNGTVVEARIVEYETSAPEEWCLLPNEVVVSVVTPDKKIAKIAVPAAAAEHMPTVPTLGRLLCVDCPDKRRFYDSLFAPR